MDQAVINDNLLCEDVTQTEIVGASGFTIKQETKFRKLKVVLSNSEGVSKGDIILVPFHSAADVDNKVIVNKRHIIYIE